MRKNIQLFCVGEFIHLPSCGWQKVVGEPWDDEEGHIFVPIVILGLKFAQLFKFDWRDEFEWKEGDNG